jgi:hypothetical protein
LVSVAKLRCYLAQVRFYRLSGEVREAESMVSRLEQDATDLTRADRTTVRARAEAAISGIVDLDHYAMALRAIRSDHAAVTGRLSFQREAARIMRLRMTAQGRVMLALEVRRDAYRKESDDLSAINEELADQQEGD